MVIFGQARANGGEACAATEPALVAAIRRAGVMVGGKKLVDRVSTKPEVEDGKSWTSSSQPNRGPP